MGVVFLAIPLTIVAVFPLALITVRRVFPVWLKVLFWALFVASIAVIWAPR